MIDVRAKSMMMSLSCDTYFHVTRVSLNHDIVNRRASFPFLSTNCSSFSVQLPLSRPATFTVAVSHHSNPSQLSRKMVDSIAILPELSFIEQIEDLSAFLARSLPEAEKSQFVGSINKIIDSHNLRAKHPLTGRRSRTMCQNSALRRKMML
jgi:hypothetical protein